MTDGPTRPPRILWVGFLLFFVLFALAFALWMIGAVRSVGGGPLPVIGQISDFTLTNQDARAFTLADLSNHVWVADIIFTRCSGPCPRMTGQMHSLQGQLPKTDDARLLTLTTDPDYDSPAVLKRYGQRYGADFNRWTFLTGTKAEIASLASGSLKLGTTPVNPAEQKSDSDLFIHTTMFVVVDRRAQLRGVFETGGDGVDWTNDVEPKLIRAIHQLAEE